MTLGARLFLGWVRPIVAFGFFLLAATKLSSSTTDTDASRLALLAHILIPFYSNMLKNGERCCDICDRTLTKGERHFTVLVPRDSVPENADIPRSGLAVDAAGNVVVDMCPQCRTAMSLSGGEEVTA